MTFEAIEPETDRYETYRQQRINDELSSGLAQLESARTALLDEDEVDWATAEDAARDGLSHFRSALNWAEDTPREEEAHLAMDRAGRWVRLTFGCWLTQDGLDYSVTCPVQLGHNRIGFSVGGSAKRVCSICCADLSECEHLPNKDYLVPGGKDDLGWCRVCRSQDVCEHSKEKLYAAPVVAIVTEMHLDEVSVVAKPRHPDARITRLSVDVDELRAALGDEWKPGMSVSCNRCLTPCTGLSRPVHDMERG